MWCLYWPSCMESQLACAERDVQACNNLLVSCADLTKKEEKELPVYAFEENIKGRMELAVCVCAW